MRTILILFLMCSVASGALVEEYKGGVLVSSYDTANTGGEITMTEGHDIYIDGVLKPQYTPEALLVWGMQNILTQEPVISMSEAQKATVIYYFGRFADNCTPAGRDLFLMAATSMGLTDLANAIIAKAIELGADIE